MMRLKHKLSLSKFIKNAITRKEFHNIRMGLFFSAMLLISLNVGISCDCAEYRLQSTWTEYFGTHYRQAVWAKTIRDPLPLVNAVFKRKKIPEKGKKYDDIVIVDRFGIRGIKLAQSFTNCLTESESNKNEPWRIFLSNYPKIVAKIAERSKNLCWQVGNEINNLTFSKAVGRSLKSVHRLVLNDTTLIPLYCEHFLAPAINAVQSAKTKYNLRSRILTAVGSIANAYTRDSESWTDKLLGYKFRGLLIKAMKGKRVFQVIDLVTPHYIVSASGCNWETKLEPIYRKWLNRGRIAGVWTTEELGKRRARRGEGASTALKLLSRYLYFWARRKIGPDQGRCYFWGWDIGRKGTTADIALRTVYEFLGETPVKFLAATQVKEGAERGEMYTIQSVLNPQRLMVIAFPCERLRSLRIRSLGIPLSKHQVRLTCNCYVFTRNGRKAVEVVPVRLERYGELLFHPPVTLTDEEVLVAFCRVASRGTIIK